MKRGVAPPGGIWDTLADTLLDVPKERPADSVTASEFAAKLNCTASFAAAKLRAMAADGKLRRVYFKTGQLKRGVCYVVAE